MKNIENPAACIPRSLIQRQVADGKQGAAVSEDKDGNQGKINNKHTKNEVGLKQECHKSKRTEENEQKLKHPRVVTYHVQFTLMSNKK